MWLWCSRVCGVNVSGSWPRYASLFCGSVVLIDNCFFNFLLCRLPPFICNRVFHLFIWLHNFFFITFAIVCLLCPITCDTRTHTHIFFFLLAPSFSDFPPLLYDSFYFFILSLSFQHTSAHAFIPGLHHYNIALTYSAPLGL